MQTATKATLENVLKADPEVTPCRGRDVAERPVAEVAIKRVGSRFVAEVQIHPPILVDVPAREPCPVHGVLELRDPGMRRVS